MPQTEFDFLIFKQIAQFVFYAITMVLLVLAVRRFVPYLIGAKGLTKAEKRLLLILAIPRLLLILAMPLNGNERGGDAFTNLSIARDFPSSYLELWPGHSYILGFFLRLLPGQFHVDSYVVLLLQHGVGILTALMLFRCISTYSQAQAWFTALGWGLFSTTLFSEHVTRPEFITAFYLFAALSLVSQYTREKGRDHGLLYWAGLSLGWAVLTRVFVPSVLPAFLIYLIMMRRDFGRLIRPILRLMAAVFLIFAAYLVFNHYPSTRSFILNFSLQANLPGTVNQVRLNTKENPYVAEIIDVHHDLGGYLYALKESGQKLADLIPFPSDPGRQLTSPELKREREAFAAFRAKYDDSDLAAYTDLSQIKSFYPYIPEDPNNYIFETAQFYYFGNDRLYNLYKKVALFAIKSHPIEQIVRIFKRFPGFFFFENGLKNYLSEYLRPPSPGEFSVARKFPLGLYLGHRSSGGIFWSPVLRAFQIYARFCEGVIWIIAIIFPIALLSIACLRLVKKIVLPAPALLGFDTIYLLNRHICNYACSGKILCPDLSFSVSDFSFSRR